MLGAADPLPHPPRRVVVAGTSGSGKTTLAARVAAVLRVPHVELDALHHGPAWTPRPAFRADVEAFSAGPAWVTEWQYGPVRTLLAERADLLVWLDLPRWRALQQVVRRTVRRRVRHEVLWNGNVEPPLRTLLTDPEHVVRWAWTSHARTREQVLAVPAQHPRLVLVRLRSHREAAAWLLGPLGRAAGGPRRGGVPRAGA